MRGRVRVVLALLAGLLLVAAIETSVGDRLSGFFLPVPVGASSPGSTAVSGPEGVVVTTGSGTSTANHPDRPVVIKAGGIGIIRRDLAVIASTSVGSPPVVKQAGLKDASSREPVPTPGAVQMEPVATGAGSSYFMP